MHDPLQIVVAILALAFALALVTDSLKLSTLPAYVVVGALISGSGTMPENELSDFAAEMGVTLLMFTVGLKFRLSAIFAMRKFTFALGGAQVAMTALLFGGVTALIGRPEEAVVVGFVAAMSSTTIVANLLIESNETHSPSGRRAIGVLLFQDLAVIPLLIVFSVGEASFAVLGIALIKIALVLAAAFLLGPRIMPRWFDWIAKKRSEELFSLNLLFVVVGSSWLTWVLGLSPALGAFLAGIFVSETWHRHRVEDIVSPFRRLFLGFFFITVGALIDLSYLAQNLHWALAATLIFYLCKAPLAALAAKMTGSHQATAWRAGFLLGGAGEFGFALMAVARESGALSEETFQFLLPVNLLAMMATSVVWLFREPLVRRLAPRDWEQDAVDVTKIAVASREKSGHVIVCGYGRTGQAIGAMLREIRIPYTALDDDFAIMQAASRYDENLIYGNASREECLLAAGIERAQALVVTYGGGSGHDALVAAKQLAPAIPVYASTAHAQEAENFGATGADAALVAAHESAISLAKLILSRRGIDAMRIKYLLSKARGNRIPLLRGHFSSQIGEFDERGPILDAITIEPDWHCVGESPLGIFAAIDKKESGSIEIAGWRRDHNDLTLAGGGALRAGDTLVVLAAAKGQERALEILRKGDERENVDSDSTAA